ncbi:MAG: zinc ribbon domain-containing protein [Parachlamydiaceae bacterium]|nr:zinc ribbon domain-containing protein [Parachlamydiaceae bacterium]
MPTYDYTCKDCGHKLEVLQKITEAPLRECPLCHKESLMRGPGGGIGIALIGDGFYKTMYGPSSGSESNVKSSETSSGGGCCPCGKGKNACSSKKSDE